MDILKSHNHDNLLFSQNNSEIRKLGYISVCQFCKKPFNADNNLPLLFNCGHFFCKNCILVNFINEQKMIVCPEDRYTFKSISELKVLHNLIQNNTITELKEPSTISSKEFESLYCKAHPGQVLTHFVENTKESVCIYCAFNKYRINPKMIIREIPEILTEIDEKLSKISEEVNYNIEVIEQHLNYIFESKEIQENKTKEFYDELLKIFSQKKLETIEKININFEENSRLLKNQYTIFKSHLDSIINLKDLSYKSENVSNMLMSIYGLETRLQESYMEQPLKYTSVFFNVEEPIKLTNLMMKFSDLKSKTERVEINCTNYSRKQLKNREINLRKSDCCELSFSQKRSSSSFRHKLQSSSSAGNLLAKSNTIINNLFSKENISVLADQNDHYVINENTTQSIELMNSQICSKSSFHTSGKIDSLINLIRDRKSKSKNISK